MVILIVLIAKKDTQKNVQSVDLKYYFHLFHLKLKIEAMYRNELLDDIINMVKII